MILKKLLSFALVKIEKSKILIVNQNVILPDTLPPLIGFSLS